MMDLLADIDWNALFEMPNPVFFCGAVVAVAAIIAPQWRKATQSRNETRMKERMIERGFSADEIERVTRAGLNEEQDRDQTSRSC